MHLGTQKSSASEMKVFVLFICAVAGATASESVAWPGAIPLTRTTPYQTIIPAQIKGVGYSISQYINAVPSAPIGYPPQFGYQISSPPYPYIPGYPIQSVLGGAYFPSNNFYYPSLPSGPVGPVSPIAPIAPIAPIGPFAPAPPISPIQPPLQNAPPQGEQPAGDEDTAVVDSAEFSQNQQPSQPQAPQLLPSFPQIPQSPQQFSPFPQVPQYQQPSLNPQPTDPPSAQPPSSFPAAVNNDQGLNDEDTISVDSA